MYRVFYGWVIASVSALANNLAWSVRSAFALFYGGFIGPFLAGYLFDRTGDYQIAFVVSALAIVGSAVAVWVAGPRNAEAFRQPLPH